MNLWGMGISFNSGGRIVPFLEGSSVNTDQTRMKEEGLLPGTYRRETRQVSQTDAQGRPVHGVRKHRPWNHPGPHQ